MSRFAVKDSACDKKSALTSAHELAQISFSGLGADAIIGAACSDASMAAADYLKQYQIPQLSPSSTSSALSDGAAYPFFARTPPSDEWQSDALADLVEHLLKVERIATVHSEDSYGASGMQAFNKFASRRNIQVLASTSFVNGQTDFSSNVDVLQRSGALVVVLFCQAADVSRFIRATQTAGLDGITWVGSDSVTPAVRSMVTRSLDCVCEGGWVQHFDANGEGATEKPMNGSFTRPECIAFVKANEPTANAATIGSDASDTVKGQCYAEFKAGQDTQEWFTDTRYQVCLFYGKKPPRTRFCASQEAKNQKAHNQASRLRGFVGLGQGGGVAEAYTAFQARLNAFQAKVLGDGYCSSASDDDGRLLWAMDVPLWVTQVQPPPTVSTCLWVGGNASTDWYAPFAYDAVYAMAIAMDWTLTAKPGLALDGIALMDQLLNTTFAGATGPVGFDEHGDRNVGLSYEVYTVANQEMSRVGWWQQGTTWSSRFNSSSSASYVAVDGSSRAPDLVGSEKLLSLGVLCEEGAAGSKRLREECDHVLHTVDRLNDKTDGWYDQLLPDHIIVTATRSTGCVEERAHRAWLALEESLPGFTAVIGPMCSNDVADVAGLKWRESLNGSRAVVISPRSTTPGLGDEVAYPNLARATGTDEHMARAFTKLCDTFGWDRVAILHDDSVWGAGAAAAFKTSFEAANGEIITTVDFDLSAFDAGAAGSGLGGPTVYVRELLARLAAASPRVIVLATQLRVQRALFAWAYDHQILSGPGYGWITFWASEEALHNDDGGVNASAIKGAEGLLGLRPSALLGAPEVVQPMVDLWRSMSSSDCAGPAYCDSDGCPASWPEYSPTTVDAVLLYAHAMDALYRTAPLSMGDPDALYAAMLQMPTFEGLTGPVKLGDDGDRLAPFTLVNLQISTGAADNPCERPRRRQLGSSINLPTTRVAFRKVGQYDSLTKRLTVSLVHAVNPQACRHFLGPCLAHSALPLAGVEQQWYRFLAGHFDSAKHVNLRWQCATLGILHACAERMQRASRSNS